MLQISNLSFSYQNQLILKSLNLTLADSDSVAIIGDNGAGKTTLLRLIANELQPDDGSIMAAGIIGFLEQTQSDLQDKSGGERTQIRLAELFRKRPEILLLNEPTNNLDTESKKWLLRELRNYRGLSLIVSHDRDFIRAFANKIIYLHDEKAELFLGDYDSFCAQQAQSRQERIQNYARIQHEKRKLKEQLKIAHDHAHKSNRRDYNKLSDESKLRYNGQRMAAQNHAGKILRATQSRLEQLAEIEKPLERKIYSAKISVNFSHDKKLLQVKNLTKSYGRKRLFENLNFEIHTSERVRICGKNGSGKSTLFQIILGETSADGGEVLLASNIKVGYISQDITSFNLEKSFLEQK